MLQPFADFDSMVAEAKPRLLGSRPMPTALGPHGRSKVSEAVEAGMVSINHHGLGLPETPFGGVKDSGYGSEGGSEAMEPYLVSKFVTHSTVD